MAETKSKPKVPAKKAKAGRKGGWFQKIPSEVLLSPGGVILIFLALILEAVDLILPPVYYLDQIIEIILEIFFMFFLVVIAEVPIKSLIIPFLIERIPVISDILPTWLIRLLM
ncbi:MAG: hypothetical protein ACPLW9_02505 [Minisyncoccales bacterium]